MKKLLIMLLIAVFAISQISFAAETTVEPAVRDGSSIEKAIIITGKYDGSIRKEYEYLEKKYGIMGQNLQMQVQSSLEQDNKSYDKMEFILLPSGEKKVLYFDITEPYADLMKQFQSKE
ncbi:acid shock protein [Candidatus Omnitrophota bacterium]